MVYHIILNIYTLLTPLWATVILNGHVNEPPSLSDIEGGVYDVLELSGGLGLGLDLGLLR